MYVTVRPSPSRSNSNKVQRDKTFYFTCAKPLCPLACRARDLFGSNSAYDNSALSSLEGSPGLWRREQGEETRWGGASPSVLPGILRGALPNILRSILQTILPSILRGILPSSEHAPEHRPEHSPETCSRKVPRPFCRALCRAMP